MSAKSEQAPAGPYSGEHRQRALGIPASAERHCCYGGRIPRRLPVAPSAPCRRVADRHDRSLGDRRRRRRACSSQHRGLLPIGRLAGERPMIRCRRQMAGHAPALDRTGARDSRSCASAGCRRAASVQRRLMHRGDQEFVVRMKATPRCEPAHSGFRPAAMLTQVTPLCVIASRRRFGANARPPTVEEHSNVLSCCRRTRCDLAGRPRESASAGHRSRSSAASVGGSRHLALAFSDEFAIIAASGCAPRTRANTRAVDDAQNLMARRRRFSHR